MSFIRDTEVLPIPDLGYCLLVEPPALFCCLISIFKTREEEGGKYRLLLDELCAKRQSREKGRAMWAWPPILKASSFSEKDESNKQNGRPQTHVTGRKTTSSAQAWTHFADFQVPLWKVSESYHGILWEPSVPHGECQLSARPLSICLSYSKVTVY